jgi:hypothetical protein
MENYERSKRTGTVRRSDGMEKKGQDQITFHKCEWVECRNKKTGKLNHYKMKLPAALKGISDGVRIIFEDRYKIKKVNQT